MSSPIRRPMLAAALLSLGIGLVSPLTVSGATVSGTYAISGHEYYATATQGRFAGSAVGSSGDRATWNASVNHTPLTDRASITGGDATLLTSHLVRIRAYFSDGSVVETSDGPNCTDQTFAVQGTLTKVTRSDSRRHGTGTFYATLTHLRADILGSCLVYSASVSGTIDLSF